MGASGEPCARPAYGSEVTCVSNSPELNARCRILHKLRIYFSSASVCFVPKAGFHDRTVHSIQGVLKVKRD